MYNNSTDTINLELLSDTNERTQSNQMSPPGHQSQVLLQPILLFNLSISCVPTLPSLRFNSLLD